MSPSTNHPPPPTSLPRMKESNYCLNIWEQISKKGLKEKMLLSRRDCCVPALAFQFKGSIVRDYKLSGNIKKSYKNDFFITWGKQSYPRERQFNFLCKGSYLKNFSCHQTSAKQINQPTNQLLTNR